MTTSLNWQDFLQTSGLPGDAACLQQSNGLHALIKVTGRDAESFLHAQLSNSVNGLEAGEVRLAAWCTAKGRVWTLLHYWRDGHALMLRMPADQVEATVKRLRMFVLRSDVQLEPLSWLATQFHGPGATAQAAEYADGTHPVISLAGAWPVHEVWTPDPLISELPELPERFLALPRLLGGIPEVFAGKREEWIPQMLNLDRLGGIDFKKGCYPGQEVVAKLHYKGGLKQRMYLASVAAEAPIGQGEDIHNNQGRKVGQVVESVVCAGITWLTAVLRIEEKENPLVIQGRPMQLLSS